LLNRGGMAKIRDTGKRKHVSRAQLGAAVILVGQRYRERVARLKAMSRLNGVDGAEILDDASRAKTCQPYGSRRV